MQDEPDHQSPIQEAAPKPGYPLGAVASVAIHIVVLGVILIGLPHSDPPQTTDDKNSKSTERTRLLLSSFRDRFLPVRVLSFRALKTDGAFGSAQLRPGASTSARRKEKRSAPAPE